MNEQRKKIWQEICELERELGPLQKEISEKKRQIKVLLDRLKSTE